MRIHLINLDRTPDRLAAFMKLNGHLRDVSRFSAVDGRHVNRSELVASAVIEPDLDYTDGALGNSLSHIGLWDRCIETDEPLTVCEDDAIFNLSFDEVADAVIKLLPPDWHLVLWGWNFDAVVLLDIIPGVSPAVMMFNQKQMREGVAAFQSARLAPRPFRLLTAFGTVCYTISPAGARMLRRLCIPIGRAPVVLPQTNQAIANKDLSISLIGAFPEINAFGSLPPLAITRNEHGVSTIR